MTYLYKYQRGYDTIVKEELCKIVFPKLRLKYHSLSVNRHMGEEVIGHSGI